jgi:hypothetical protein
LQLKEVEIDLNKEDAKAIWQQIQKELPIFALFRSDRPSTDEDDEVQDPMKLAIKQAIAELSSELEDIKIQVQRRALDVANRTLDKLKEFDERLSSELKPTFRAEPKWDGIFKLAIMGDNDIPINKRGSGVRRLVLFSFFRAEAERQRDVSNRLNIIYGVEEPETSQHPANQRLVVEAFRELSEQDTCQVVLTTHVPGLAGLVPTGGVRYLAKQGDGSTTIELGTEQVLKTVADELGVLPDKRIQVFLCVEGPTDVSFLRHINRIICKSDTTIPDLSNDQRIVLLPLGGSTLWDWVNDHYLRNTGIPEIHIYDRDTKAEYKEACTAINARGDGSRAFLTAKREIENYLHGDAIAQVLGVKVTVDDTMDVEEAVSTALGQNKVQRRSVKRWLNDEVAAAMTIEMLCERGGCEEIKQWFKTAGSLLK